MQCIAWAIVKFALLLAWIYTYSFPYSFPIPSLFLPLPRALPDATLYIDRHARAFGAEGVPCRAACT